uniref:Uncharacterized protein n=1 Tax=Anopheles dirus TaxID=7168 RepID=A0A182NYW4_9DIPT
MFALICSHKRNTNRTRRYAFLHLVAHVLSLDALRMQVTDRERRRQHLRQQHLRAERRIEAQIVPEVAPPLLVLAHHLMEPVDQRRQLVAARSHRLVRLALAVLVFDRVHDTLRQIRTVHRLLHGLLALMPQRHRAELPAPDVRVVAQEPVLLPVDVRRAEHDRIRELLAHRLLAVVLALQELAALLREERLRMGCRVQARHVHELFHARLAGDACQPPRTVHVHVLEDRFLVAQIVRMEQHLAQIADQLQAQRLVMVSPVRNDHLAAGFAQLITHVAPEESGAAEHSRHDPIEAGPTAGTTLQRGQ